MKASIMMGTGERSIDLGLNMKQEDIILYEEDIEQVAEKLKKCIQVNYPEPEPETINKEDILDGYKIPWDEINEKYKFCAIDKDGELCAYVDRPKISKIMPMWAFTDLDNPDISVCHFERQFENWQELLFERPEKKTEDVQ